MGDVLRHSYHKIDDEIIWNTVKDELPQMREAVMKALRTLSLPHSSENNA